MTSFGDPGRGGGSLPGAGDIGLTDRRAERVPGRANFRGIGQFRESLEPRRHRRKRRCAVKDRVNVEELELSRIEHQEAADKRIPELLAVPAACRGISAEPLLGEVDLQAWLNVANRGGHGPQGTTSRRPNLLHWVIAGGESGGRAHPMHPGWVRSLRDQCAAAGVHFFFKQWGEWRPPADGEAFDTTMGRAQKVPAFMVDRRNGTVSCFHSDDECDPAPMLRVTKKKAGRLLDGREHNEFPEVLHHG